MKVDQSTQEAFFFLFFFFFFISFLKFAYLMGQCKTIQFQKTEGRPYVQPTGKVKTFAPTKSQKVITATTGHSG